MGKSHPKLILATLLVYGSLCQAYSNHIATLSQDRMDQVGTGVARAGSQMSQQSGCGNFLRFLCKS